MTNQIKGSQERVDSSEDFSTLEDLSEMDALSRVRHVRHKISAEHGHDPARLIRHLMERQKEHEGRIITKTDDEER